MFSIALAFFIGATAPPSSEAQPQEKLQLHCEAGPLHKTFGGYPWLVYGCSDGASIVVVSEKENPASPFYFMILAKDGGYAITGEGNGSKDASSAAFDELKLLTPAEITALFGATAAR